MVWGAQLFFLPSQWGEPVRRMYFLTAILAKSVFLVCVVIITMIAHQLLLHGQIEPEFFTHPVFYSVIAFVFCIVAVLQTIAQIVRITGGRVLINFILGKYHTPVSEERIFMFLDLVGSTQLAERLGDIGVQTMITRFFFDISEPIIEFGGEIHRYIGDQVVIIWPLDKGANILRAILCYFAIFAKATKIAPDYEREFGSALTFRVGLHGGPVVVSECGDFKQELVYYGNSVNTAARIEQQCKAFDCSFLVSGDLINRIDLPNTLSAQSKGVVQLRGLKTETELFTIVPSSISAIG
ncbi:adenylate/guanylate cyclase domain-containing protein [Pseudomonadota bacterium]